MQMIVHAKERNQDHLDLMHSMLEHYIDAVEIQAKRRADQPMSLTEIRTVNELLSELRTFFSGSEAEEYLKPAEEPENGQAGTTYGEMVLLLVAYRCTIFSFNMGHLWYKKTEDDD